MRETLESFIKSLARFEEILQAKKTVANRDSAIKRFEFTAELAWKCIQKFLRQEKIICRSPKECLKEAFKFGLIADDAAWLPMMKTETALSIRMMKNLPMMYMTGSLLIKIFSRK